jgi:transglutaminase-like putative cysteine protease
VDGAGAQHAWAEAFCEPIGWVAFDAALGYCPRDAHLRIAQGLDFLGAAPRRAARLGYAAEEICAVLSVKAAHQASWQVQQ